MNELKKHVHFPMIQHFNCSIIENFGLHELNIN